MFGSVKEKVQQARQAAEAAFEAKLRAEAEQIVCRTLDKIRDNEVEIEKMVVDKFSENDVVRCVKVLVASYDDAQISIIGEILADALQKSEILSDLVSWELVDDLELRDTTFSRIDNVFSKDHNLLLTFSL